MIRIRPTRAAWSSALLVAFLALGACGGDESPPPPDEAAATGDESAPPPDESAATADESTPPPEEAGATGTEAAAAGETGEEIDPDSLVENGGIVIKQYQAAFIGSGTLGKGTLSYGGQQVPFRIGGLGIGGIGVAAIDATGTVYNLNELSHFPGAYGNARLGATAADQGKGRLWLKNTHGVVIKLWTDMQGLALTGGVDGIVIEWESEVQQGVGKVKEGSKKAWEDVKKPFQ